jgi:hypothetical protein
MIDQRSFPYRRNGFGLLGAALLLSACTQSPLPTQPTVSPEPSGSVLDVSSPRPSASPSPTPAAKRYFTDFESATLGSVPADFVDVTTEETVPAWVYKGNWAVTADEAGNKVLMHDDVRQQPAVSFQRYRGTALGSANGRVPDLYYTEVAMRPIRSPHNYTPTGDQGVQFYYLKYDTYLEVVVKPTFIEIWEANNAEPKTTKGWKRLWGQALNTKGGDVRKIGALVDVKAGTFTAYLDGKPLSTVKSDILKPQAAYVALRGIGNVVSFDDFLIEAR